MQQQSGMSLIDKREREHDEQYSSQSLLSSTVVATINEGTYMDNEDSDYYSSSRNSRKHQRSLLNQNNNGIFNSIINDNVDDSDWYDEVNNNHQSCFGNKKLARETLSYDDDEYDYDDVYNMVGTNHNSEIEEEDEIIRSSWMKKSLEWISIESLDYVINNCSNNTSTDDTIANEIKCLGMQLSLIKRRLSPASEQYSVLYNECNFNYPIENDISRNNNNINNNNSRFCNHQGDFFSSHRTKERNSLNKNTKSKTPMNASIVFNNTRRECNPYEVLTERNCRNLMVGRRRRRRRRQQWCNFHNNTFSMNCIGCMFINRAAVKLANIDSLLGLQLTQIGGSYNNNLLSTSCSTNHHMPIDNNNPPRHCFSFVDLCSAPGGFSEYLLWRVMHEQEHGEIDKISQVYGFAMSLVGRNEQGYGTSWKLQNIVQQNNERQQHQQQNEQQFHLPNIHYEICSGADGTGDIYNWENVRHLQRVIKDRMTSQCVYSNDDRYKNYEHNVNKDDGRVQLVLADGGFDAQRDNDHQEQMTQKIIVCQVGAALTLIRTGGTLVIKMFGFQTPVVRTVLRYLYVSFQRITVVKPITSRPASAERYVIATGYYGHEYKIPNWDGPKWCSEMFLCSTKMIKMIIGSTQLQHGIPSNNTSTVEALDIIFAPLNQYLDKFDRNMLKLNVKACFTILSRMESKYQTLQRQQQELHELYSSNTDDENEVENDNEMDDECTSTKNKQELHRRLDSHVVDSMVNVPKYKYCWRLMSAHEMEQEDQDATM